MKRIVSTLLQLTVVAALAWAGYFVWQDRDRAVDVAAQALGLETAPKTKAKKRKRGGKSVPVIVARVGEARNDELITAVGTARARRSVMLHPKADGVMISFGPKAGSRVAEGERVFEIDSNQAELAVQIARKRKEEAQRLLERSELLKKNRVNSVAKVDDAKVVFERAELELQQAQETLRDLKITAPFDGVVGIPKAETGDRVTTSMPIVSLDQRNELLVEFEVAERFAARVSEGDKVSAATPSHENTRFDGHIEYIDSRIDPASRTVKVRAVIPNKDDVLRPGMSFVVELLLPGGTHTAVPELSLQWRKGESFIWLAEDGKAKKVLVKTIKRLNAIVLVEGDVKPGDLVIAEGVQRLRPGRKVDYAPPGEETAPPPDTSAKAKSDEKG